ncbi:MAG: hypothetical protein GAK30_01618 [Paracidovorax wautersii]|uniref:Uncharacterized protein n=1 Tax=Paracidovorax wautersii TaxID=1177982 RepID=A0A7V8FPI3_9BURK|nr:MAG: hypothetical protein GAK30_01618 [Paracidovorax wautersii]
MATTDDRHDADRTSARAGNPASPRPLHDEDQPVRVAPDNLPTSVGQTAPDEPPTGEVQGESTGGAVPEADWRDDSGIDDVSAPPQPLDFDDGTEAKPNGPRPGRDGGTWDDEGADHGRLKPPSELHSDRRR